MRKSAGAWFAAVALLGMGDLVAPGRALGQGAVAFQPIVGTLPDGVGLNATPVVSADRRYVRLSLGFGSSTVQGLQNIPFPAGAVGMGGGQLGGGLGGLLGGGGGGGAGAGTGRGGNGFMSVLTGMDGPVAPGSMAGNAPMTPPAGLGSAPIASADLGLGDPQVQPRRPGPRRSRADRAKAERKAVAAARADAESKADKPK